MTPPMITACFVLALAATGCSTLPTEPGGDGIIAYARPAATIAAALVIEKGHDTASRQKLAAQLVRIAMSVATVTNPDVTSADISRLIIQEGGDRPEYRALALTVSILIDRYRVGAVGNPKMLLLLNDIAHGILDGAQPYDVTPREPLPK